MPCLSQKKCTIQDEKFGLNICKVNYNTVFILMQPGNICNYMKISYNTAVAKLIDVDVTNRW